MTMTTTTMTIATRNRVAENNRGLANCVANKFAERGLGPGVTVDDLSQTGMIALMGQVDSHDPVKGKISTHSRLAIFEAVKRECRKFQGGIIVPVDVGNMMSFLGKRMSKAEVRDLSTDELTELLGVRARKAEAVRRLFLRSWVADDTEGESLSVLNLVADSAPSPSDAMERAEEAESVRKLVSRYLAILSVRSRDILILRYGLDGQPEKTLAEIGKIHGGMTFQNVQLIIKRAFKKIRIHAAMVADSAVSETAS